MNNKRLSKSDVLNILYRFMYMLPLAMAIIAESRIQIGNLLSQEKYANTVSAAGQGGIYAGMVLLAFFAAFLVSLVITLTTWTKLGTGVLVIAAVAVTMILKITPQRLTVASLLWLVPILAADIIRSVAKKESESRVVFLLPFLTIAFLMTNFIPISEKPLDWSGFVSVCNRIYEGGKTLLNKLDWDVFDYGTAEMGFDGTSGLFHKMKSKHEDVMEVEREYPTSGAVYMTGKIYSDFDGKNWYVYKPEDGEPEYGRMIDTIETMAAVNETYPNHLRYVYTTTQVSVKIRKIKTPYVFLPGKMTVNTRNSMSVEYDADNCIFDESKGYGYEYRVTYQMLNRNGEDLIKYHRDITEETFSEIAHRYRTVSGDEFTYEDLLAYREYVSRIYGQEPVISDEVRVLLDEITEGAETDYEKMCLIQDWLSEHVYTLEVDNKGKGIKSEGDYLDYFLLENTEGYCSYYATAFVLMARAEGVPARYVQGYRIPSSPYRKIEVTSAMAHAWPEVYFEGVGWIRFEPTPGFGSVPSWGEPLKSPDYYDELALQEEAAAEEAPDEAEISEVVSDYDTEEMRAAELAEQERLKEEARKRRQVIITIAASILAGIIAMGLLLICARLIARAVRYRRMSDDEKRVEICLRCILVLESMGRRPQQGETLAEYSERVSEELGIKNMEFIDAYERILYRSGSSIKITALWNNYYEIKKLLRGRKRNKARVMYALGVIFDRKVFVE